jgi:predicted RNA-binding Zn-ribbon protein involved in translation (DUF1610 family)
MDPQQITQGNTIDLHLTDKLREDITEKFFSGELPVDDANSDEEDVIYKIIGDEDLTDGDIKVLSAILSRQSNTNEINCIICNKSISPYASSCPYCGEPMAKRCPKCKSANISRLTGVDKGLGVALFGVFAANTVLNDYQCRDCKEKFR